MKKVFTKFLSIILSLIMVFSTVQPALANYTGDEAAEDTDSLILTDDNGTEVRVSELWEETYPFGAFAFDVTALSMAEGEDATVTVYRAGGTSGRATAYIAYSPLLTPNEDGSVYYGYALSGEDLTLEVEDPLPIAQYQALGKYPNPESGDAYIIRGEDEEGYVLTLSEEADSYQWQALYDGNWCGIVKAESATLPMDREYIDDGKYDYRCIYTKDGVRYCTQSLRGIAYEKEPEEVLEPMPDDIELNPEPSFTSIALNDKDDLYSGWLFNLTFADGEYKKEIHLHANTDEASELMEASTFRIAYCNGGEIYSGSETLLLHVDDKNESTPSTVGFTVAGVTVDKAEGYAELRVRRVGGVERPVSVEYATEDGSAVSGRDYISAAGTLMFYGNVTELPIKVELIDDQIKQDSPLSFTVTLSELKGDDKCSMEISEATVSLINSGTGSATNLASVLYDADTVDLSSIITEAPVSANSGSEPVTGEQIITEEEEPVSLELIPIDESKLGTQSYAFPNQTLIQFKNPKNPYAATKDLASIDNFDKPNSGTLYKNGQKTASLGGTNGGGYHDPITLNMGVAFGSNKNGYASMKTALTDYMAQYYSGFTAFISAYYAHGTSYLEGFTYRYPWTKPRVSIYGQDVVSVTEPASAQREGSGPLNASWVIKGKMSNSSSYQNPIEYERISKTFSGTGKIMYVRLETPYNGTNKHEKTDLNAESLIWLQKFTLTRRNFPENAFTVDITTPNDANTAPEGCATIQDYEAYYPTITIKEGGVKGTNSVYVGTTINIKAGNAAGLYPEKLVIQRYNSKTKTWERFNKFKTFGGSLASGIDIQLIADPSNPLTVDEINSQYKFRIVYARETNVNVDLAPSLPRNEDGNPDASQVDQLFNNYNNKYSTCFSSKVRYGFSQYNEASMDYETKIYEVSDLHTSENGVITINGNPNWQLAKAKNIQWIQFPELDPKDILLVNGTDYPGNAKIYLKESDLTGALNIVYYHSAFQHFVNPMTTAISWVQLYFDGDGNGSIDGKLNEAGNFELAKDSKDEFIAQIMDGDTFNEMELAPVDLGNGKYGQYFFQICYTMTPRCLDEIAEEKGKSAQILPAVTTAVDPKASNYKDLTKEQRQYNYVISGKDSDGNYTSDNHLMFTAKANKKSLLSVPAGGDKSPAHLDGSLAEYVWDPDWYENNLFLHSSPELIIITNSIAGETKVADAEVTAVTAHSGHRIKGVCDKFEDLTKFQPASAGDAYIVGLTGASDFTIYYWSSKTNKWEADNKFKIKGRFANFDELKKVYKNDSDWDGYFVVGPDSQASIYRYDSSAKEWMPFYKYEYTYKSDAARNQMNGYLASLTGTSRIVMVSQIQENTTAELLSNKRVISSTTTLVKPDSVTVNQFSTSPDAEYLKVMKSDGNSKNNMKMHSDGDENGGKGELTEFSMPFDMNFGSNEVSATDYVTILFDENSVGFAISLPLCGYEEENGQTTGEKKNFADTNKEAWTQFADFFKENKFNDKSLQNAFAKKNDATNTDKFVKSSKFSVSLSVSAAFMWQYNPLDNGYYFSMFEIGISGELEFRAQARLTVCPPVYGYLDVSFSLEIKTGLGVIRTSKQGDEKLKDVAGLPQAVELTHYEDMNGVVKPQRPSYVLETDKKALDVKFDGKLYVYVQVSTDGGTTWMDADEYDKELEDKKKLKFISGTIGSDGASYTQLVLRQQDGMDLPVTNNGDSLKYRVVFVAMDQTEKNADVTTIKSIREIANVRDFVHWNGISITPELAFEIGMGVGAELLKLELYLHISVGATFTFGMYNQNYDPNSPDDDKNFMYHPAAVESFDFNIGIGLRVVLLFFSYELDLVSYQVSYNKNAEAGKQWECGWHFLNDLVEAELEGEDAGVTVSLPEDKSGSMRTYSPEDNAGTGLSAQAYDVAMPFQVPGFGPSVDAFKLSDNIPEGSSYKVIRAGHHNFVVYTAAREGAPSGEDRNMLVMSELGYTAKEGGGYAYGLVNPADGSPALPYITLDNDATGDLDFDLSVSSNVIDDDETSYTIHAAWVSYASPTNLPDAPSMPSAERPKDSNGNVMNADNYNTPAFSAYDSSDWYTYYESLESYNTYLRERARDDALNTVVKTADWSFVEKKTEGSEHDSEGNPVYSYSYESRDSAFTAPTTVSDNANTNYVFLPTPSEDGSAVFFASTNDLRKNDATLDKYKAYQAAKNLDQKIQNYLNATKQANLDVYGTQSALNVKVDGAVHSYPLPDGETLTNVEFARAGENKDYYYLAYTTEQTAIEDNNSNMSTVYSLYLQKFTPNSNSDKWGSRILIRKLIDYDKNSETAKDGVFGSTNPSDEYTSPYLANLSFLTANIDASALTSAQSALTTQDSEKQTILVFEMNGASYIIPSESLDAIVNDGDNTLKKLYPFFTPPTQKNAEGDTVAEGSSGKLQVNINVDDNNNLYAVYVGSVPGTTNNALYVSTYENGLTDSEGHTVGKWGDGIMVAMHDMNTYEASVRNGWDNDTTEAAYLYGAIKDDENAPVTKAKLKNLFGDRGEDILYTLDAYKGAAENNDKDFGDANSFNFSGIQTVQGANKELLVVTMGSMRELEIASYTTKNSSGALEDVTEYVVVPTTEDNSVKSTVGTYVLSFGQGAKALGDATIAFDRMDFSAGSELYVSISAKNVGSTAIRGSNAQPVKATLKAGRQEINEWTLNSSVISGQEISLSGYCKPLPENLPNGTKFTLTLAEYNNNETYHGTTVSVDLFTVNAKPDLAVEDMVLYPESTSGMSTTVSVDFIAANRGSAEAKNVYVQFSYKDANGEYKPLDISTNTLVVDQEKKLENRLSTMDLENKFTLGILALRSLNASGKETNCNIASGYGKRVHGTITIPNSVFAADESGHVQIKAELFSDASSMVTMSAENANEANHKEYYAANNLSTQSFEAFTTFGVAHSIVIPLGSTTKVPFTATSSRGTTPVINVEEIENDDGFNIGILNFKQNGGSSEPGKVSGYLSFTPTAVGNGVIHVTDLETNSTFSIAFVVTESNKGIDIYKDNGSFSFFNANNTPYDDKASGQDWIFPGMNKWGNDQVAPLRSNLAIAMKNGAYFTFESVAESLSLYFKGRVSVTSTNPGFSEANGGHDTIIIANSTGGDEPTKGIQLGRNADNAGIYEVKITALDSNTEFDRLEEYYATKEPPKPSYDSVKPNFYWSRSFPETGSIEEKANKIPLKVYVVDNNGIASISVSGKLNGQPISGQISDPNISGDAVESLDADQLLWSYDFGEIASNGNVTIVATDVSGNSTTEILYVDWFKPKGIALEHEETVDVPLYTADFYNADAPVTGVIKQSETDNLNIKFSEVSGNTKDTNNSFEVYPFRDSTLTAMLTAAADNEAKFPIGQNGLYWARVINEQTVNENGADKTVKTWSAQILNLTSIDGDAPQVYLGFNAQSSALEWTAKKKTSSAAVIDSVTINGYKVNGTSSGKELTGSFPIAFSGKYLAAAKDNAGNSGKAENIFSNIGIILPDAFAPTTTGVTNEASPDGTVSINLTGITGGYYDSEASDEANGSYKSKYLAVLVKAGAVTDAELATDESRQTYISSLSDSEKKRFSADSGWTATWNGLSQGAYKLIISDEGDGGSTGLTHFSQVIDVYVAGEMPHVTAKQAEKQISEDAVIDEGNAIDWTAAKDPSAAKDITRVAVNGFAVNQSSGKDLSGSFPIAFSGKYVVVASDDNGKTDSASVTVADVAISLPNSENTAVAEAVWDNTKSNGSISLNLEGITGGYYDKDKSSPAENKYYGSYSAILVTPAVLKTLDDNAQKDEALAAAYSELAAGGREAEFNKDNWKHEWKELEPGMHKIIIRDTGLGGLESSPLTHSTKVISINVSDERIKISGVTLKATSPSSHDGKMIIRNAGSSTGLLEFALISTEELDESIVEAEPVKNYKDAEKAISELKEKISKNTDPDKTSELSAELIAKQEALEALRENLVAFFIDYAKTSPEKVNWTLADYGLANGIKQSTFDEFFASDYKDIAPFILNNLASKPGIIAGDSALKAAYEAHSKAQSELSALEEQINSDPSSENSAELEAKRNALDSAKKAFVRAFTDYAKADPNRVSWLIEEYTFKNNIQGRTFDELASGSYYVIARKVYGDTDTAEIKLKHSELDADYKVYISAIETRSTLEKAVEDIKAVNPGNDKDKQKQKEEDLKLKQELLENAEEALDAAREAFDASFAAYCAAVSAVSSGEYRTQGLYWNGADVISVELTSGPRRYIPSSDDKGSDTEAEHDAVSDISLSENGSVVFTVKAGEPLSSADQAALREANATAPIIIASETLSVTMPAGAIASEGFDVNLMIADVSKAKPGMVVEYTDKNGNLKVDILGVVGEGKASYVASEEGTYRIVESKADFSDISGLWSEDSIKFVTSRKMFLGTGDGQFSPEAPMSRAMFVTVLWRIAGSPEQSEAAPFSDITADWCADAVSWAAELGIVSGYANGKFGQDDPVTREQMCVFIQRSMEKLGWKLSSDNKHGSFKDESAISGWAGSAVDACADIGLINGFENGSFAPQNKATRGETSAILERFVQKVVEYLCK